MGCATDVPAAVPVTRPSALLQHADHFNLSQRHADRDGARTSLIQADVNRQVTSAIIPRRPNATGNVPFNPLKSSKR